MTVESLTPITEAELLKQVKVAIGAKGNNYNDDTIQIWIEDVKLYLSRAGVSADVLGSTLAVGCISRGVDDKWASHRESYSDLFYSGAEVLRDIKTGYNSKNISVTLLGSVIKNNFVVQEETSILNIGIDGYSYSTDNLALFVNGLKFDQTRYTVIDNNTVRLSLPVVVGTKIEFVVTKLEKAVAE